MSLKRFPLTAFRQSDDCGAATVEFVFLGVLILVPLFYATIAIFSVQNNSLAATQAAREAGRAVVTAPDIETGVARAQYGVRLTMKSFGVERPAVLRFIRGGESCSAGPAAPDPGAASLVPGARFTVCVANEFDVPAVPSFFEGSSKTITGRYEVQVDKLRVKE